MPVSEKLVQAGLLGDAVDAGPALIFVADDEMRYVAVNQTACDILGYSREELLGMRVTDVATSEDSPDLYEQLMADRRISGRTVIATKAGQLLRFDYRASETTMAAMRFYVSIGFVERET